MDFNLEMYVIVRSTKGLCITNGVGIVEHEQAAKLIAELLAFYDRVSDIEIEDNNRAALRDTKAGHVYLVARSDGLYKIGRSRNVDQRMVELKRMNECSDKAIFLVHTIRSSDCDEAEIAMHERYADRRVKGEWFRLTPEDVQTIKSIESM